MILSAGDHSHITAELEITAADRWQDMVVPAARLVNRFDGKPMADWSNISRILLTPKPGSDLTKVLFADFRWLPADHR